MTGWDTFWLVAAWLGLGFVAMLALVVLVWIVSRLTDGPVPSEPRLPVTPMWTTTYEPKEKK